MQHHNAHAHALSRNVSLMKAASVESLPTFAGKDEAYPRSGASRIDYSKYKTRLCRHFIRGLPCPFRERCVFAHGEEVAKMALKEPVSTPASPLDSQTCIYTPESNSFTGEERSTSSNGLVEEVSAGDYRVRSGSVSQIVDADAIAALPPPPTYESALQTEDGVTAPADFLPPTYPRRYRFDPYNASGIVYERE